jgi:hypothetical protein
MHACDRFVPKQARKKSSKNYRVVINILINNLQQKLERLNSQDGAADMDEDGTRVHSDCWRT